MLELPAEPTAVDLPWRWGQLTPLTRLTVATFSGHVGMHEGRLPFGMYNGLFSSFTGDPELLYHLRGMAHIGAGGTDGVWNVYIGTPHNQDKYLQPAKASVRTIGRLAGGSEAMMALAEPARHLQHHIAMPRRRLRRFAS